MIDHTAHNSPLSSIPAGPLRIGARDWEHPGWGGGFYPEDLPKEWRLTYYANEFSTVLLSPERQLAEGCMEEWAEEVHDDFRFVLEKGGAPATAEELPGPRFGGRVVAVELWRPGAEVAPSRFGVLPNGPHGPRALRGMLEAFVGQAPDGERFLFLEGEPPEIETLRTLVTLRDLMGY